jgi:hypothetical protein
LYEREHGIAAAEIEKAYLQIRPEELQEYHFNLSLYVNHTPYRLRRRLK